MSHLNSPHEFAVSPNPYISALVCAICKQLRRNHRCCRPASGEPCMQPTGHGGACDPEPGWEAH